MIDNYASSVSSSASVQFGGSGLFNLGITVLYGGLIVANPASPAGAGRAIFNGGNLTYVLAAPQGHYLDAVFLCGQCLERICVWHVHCTLSEKTALPPSLWRQAYQRDSKVAPTAAPAFSRGAHAPERSPEDNPSTHAWHEVFGIQAPRSGSIRLLAPKAPRVRGSSRTPDATTKTKEGNRRRSKHHAPDLNDS